MSSLAIVGSGIAGLGCAHFLHREHEITLFEQDGHVGGHANTVTTREPGTDRVLPIDTGFMVFNRVTYPLLCRLFDELKVPVKRTDMSFSVRDPATGLEWCGSSLNHLFAQRKNLFNLRFLRMLGQVNRFNTEAIAALADPEAAGETLADYVRRRRYGDDFQNLYLIPMSSAVWSTPPELMLGFPARTLLQFFHNHGFLGMHTQHPWWTVDGGAREYVGRISAAWHDRIRTRCAAIRVSRARGSVAVTTRDGVVRTFDRVILATHADQALALLADPTSEETRLLRTFRYQANTATLHTDASVMPRTRRAWAAWNYELARGADGRFAPATHYYMNRLQGVSEREHYFVSINRAEQIAPDRVLRQIAYHHPLFSLDAIRAQPQLPQLNEQARGTTETYFAGSYFRYGFHEDGFMSAVRLSELLLDRDPWSRPAAAVAEPVLA